MTCHGIPGGLLVRTHCFQRTDLDSAPGLKLQDPEAVGTARKKKNDPLKDN